MTNNPNAFLLVSRRHAIKAVAATVLASTLPDPFALRAQTMAPAPSPAGPFSVPPLPYAYDALEPTLDVETMHLHHDKHHAAYVAKLNEAVAKEPSLAATTNVDDLLKNLSAIPETVRTAIRNNGGGHSNHSLFWQTLTPKSSGQPSGDLLTAMQSDLGGFDKFKEDAIKVGLRLFGSGWVWLALDGSKKLVLLSSPNQDSPFSEGSYPLFGIDVWEHAYYLKYHNVRADYLKAIWTVINWDFISARYSAALKS